VELMPRVKVELVLSPELVEPAVEAIRHAAGIDRIGGADIIVWDLQDAVRIRTGEGRRRALSHALPRG
jgi:nitrogen regulatory protein PII